jgi:hypothetical protein
MGRFLKEGEAKTQFDAFWAAGGGGNLPFAVCYTITELATFLQEADKTLGEDNVPQEQRGIALMLGIHLDQSSSHAKNKPTIMLVATQWQDNPDPNAGKVDVINNPVIQGGTIALAPPPPVKDTSYDAGSLWP